MLFKSRKNRTWIFRIDKDYSYHSTTVDINIYFENDWLILNPINNQITIKSQYSWDGCSPKLNIFDLFVIGVPDGRINIYTGKPYTYYPSLVHDALCQFKDDVPLSMNEITFIFEEMLQAWGDFKPTPLYVAAVRYLGPRKSCQ